MFQISFYFLIFFGENCNPLKKVTPSFPETPLLKAEILSNPTFENLVRGSNPPPPSRKGGGGAHYGLAHKNELTSQGKSLLQKSIAYIVF